MNMKWNKVSKVLPKEQTVNQSHMVKLWIDTGIYGCMVGFYHEGKFMRDYASEILNPIAWMELPYGIDS